MAQDPTKAEMLAFLATQTCGEELDEFDAEEAIYWFAYSYRGGQSSNLYSAMSTSPYSPGPITNGPEESSMGELLLDSLIAEFA